MEQTGTRLFRIFALMLAPVLACCAGSRAAELDDALGRIVNATTYEDARIGIHVVALGTGRVIYARNADELYIPASNQKIVTAAAALLELGADYKFRTRLCGLGTLQDGALDGDIILEASGDPSIGGEGAKNDALTEFRAWAKLLHTKGLRNITGDVVVDDSLFDRTFDHPGWPATDTGKAYAPTVGAASANDNCVTIHASPGAAAGAPAIVSIDPSCSPLKLDISVRTATRTAGLSLTRAEGSADVRVRGFAKLGSYGESALITVPDPTLYTGHVLKAALEAEGITVAGNVRAAAEADLENPEDRLELVVREATLVGVLGTMMRESHNLSAEMLVKTMGAQEEAPGSWPKGLAVVGSTLKEWGFDEDDYVLEDGCGLSRRNRLSPALLTTVLFKMHSSDVGAEFVGSLPVAGQSGTLRKRLTAAPYKDNVRAKTGYINGVTGLSGYAKTRAGTTVAFSILVNHDKARYSFRELREKICRAIVDKAR